MCPHRFRSNSENRVGATTHTLGLLPEMGWGSVEGEGWLPVGRGWGWEWVPYAPVLVHV